MRILDNNGSKSTTICKDGVGATISIGNGGTINASKINLVGHVTVGTNKSIEIK